MMQVAAERGAAALVDDLKQSAILHGPCTGDIALPALCDEDGAKVVKSVHKLSTNSARVANAGCCDCFKIGVFQLGISNYRGFGAEFGPNAKELDLITRPMITMRIRPVCLPEPVSARFNTGRRSTSIWERIVNVRNSVLAPREGTVYSARRSWWDGNRKQSCLNPGRSPLHRS